MARELAHLAQSDFRARFRLNAKDREAAQTKGDALLRQHALEIITKRLAPAQIANDGHQTPMKGHPVFTAQHATACCCRQCFAKWWRVPAGRPLSEKETEWAVGLITRWIARELEKPAAQVRSRPPKRGESGSLFEVLVRPGVAHGRPKTPFRQRTTVFCRQ